MMPSNERILSAYRGCLIGGAVGDALGAPVEFLSRSEIGRRFGEAGIRDLAPAYGRLGAITDDTQMALFTAEGMLRAWVRSAMRGVCHPPSVIAYAYLRWLYTQGEGHALHDRCLDGWLIEQKGLFAQRAPGITCLSSLRALQQVGTPARNDSKGCGGVMRVAPIGLLLASQFRERAELEGEGLSRAFDLACEAAAITHGHPTGRLAAGALSALVFLLLSDRDLPRAVDEMLDLLEQQASHQETSLAVRNAVRLAEEQPNDYYAVRQLGEGWIAEEALAIGLYCALSAADFESGVLLAVNHSGDSDSTGLIAGQLLGALHGVSAIPRRWCDPLELRDVITQVADDLATAPEWKLDECGGRSGDDLSSFPRRYPGW